LLSLFSFSPRVRWRRRARGVLSPRRLESSFVLRALHVVLRGSCVLLRGRAACSFRRDSAACPLQRPVRAISAPGRLCAGGDDGVTLHASSRGSVISAAGRRSRCTVIAFSSPSRPTSRLNDANHPLPPRNNQFEMTTASNANSFVAVPPPGSSLASSVEGESSPLFLFQ
jgi:hypothetical protein